jgi:putative transposase
LRLKRERPERTGAQVPPIMLASGERPPTVRTLQTHFARAGLNVRADGRSPGKVYGRFEAAARNELWTGDGLHGPVLAGSAARRAVLLAFIDDHSRLLVGWRWGAGEDVFRLEAALRAGLMSRGVPEAILVDYVARHKIDLLCPNRLCAVGDVIPAGTAIGVGLPALPAT